MLLRLVGLIATFTPAMIDHSGVLIDQNVAH